MRWSEHVRQHQIVGVFGDNWDDERSPAISSKLGANAKPDYDYTDFGLLFPQNSTAEYIIIANQLPHACKNGDVTFYPHVHYIQDEAEIPVFKLEYRFYNNGEAVPASFTTISTADGDGLVFSYSSGSIMQIARFPNIAISDIGSSMWYDMKLYRDDNVVTGDILVKSFDFHIPIDALGSRDQYRK